MSHHPLSICKRILMRRMSNISSRSRNWEMRLPSSRPNISSLLRLVLRQIPNEKLKKKCIMRVGRNGCKTTVNTIKWCPVIKIISNPKLQHAKRNHVLISNRTQHCSSTQAPQSKPSSRSSAWVFPRPSASTTQWRRTKDPHRQKGPPNK